MESKDASPQNLNEVPLDQIMPNYNLRFNVNISHTSKDQKRGSAAPPQLTMPDDLGGGMNDIIMDTKHIRQQSNLLPQVM